ncbi:FHA domain-containing protein [Singulisphaera sp. GP187]|uniref:FHA domain-containing protein n=1 Tax=Singulisphaera sp. GP187 TaxID=1882752 RepID=UPI000927D3E9|nr:FHA domain-containing protein [Singulisphaera sp. GP187]SIO39096.1 FHA domain-containing protein [Singulisphaera sp. GP187]
MTRSWTIGSDPDCDLVVDHQAVSARHCRLTSVGGTGYLLEDLGSTNGTFVDGQPVTAPLRVSQDNRITLGRSQPMPWPEDSVTRKLTAPTVRVLRIGREPDNDLVVDLPTVSSYHARVVWSGRPGQAEIEDLGSSNGTAVGAPERKAARAVVSLEDTIYLGMYPLSAARIFEALGPPPGLLRVGADPVVIGRDPGGIGIGPVLRPLLFLGLGPLAGVLAVATSGFDPKTLTNDPEQWAGAGRTLATLLSRLGLGAVGLGLVIGAGVGAGTRTFPPAGLELGRWLVRVALAAMLCLVAGLLEWETFRVLSGADLAEPSALAMLWLGAGVGLTLGLVVATAASRPAVAWILVAFLAVLLWGLGGESRSWLGLPAWARRAAGLNPSRWVFEGLLLNASARAPAPAGTLEDLAEPFFSAATDRTGPGAVTLALGALWLGWGAVALFIAAETRPPPAERPAP